MLLLAGSCGKVLICLLGKLICLTGLCPRSGVQDVGLALGVGTRGHIAVSFNCHNSMKFWHLHRLKSGVCLRVEGFQLHYAMINALLSLAIKHGHIDKLFWAWDSPTSDP